MTNQYDRLKLCYEVICGVEYLIRWIIPHLIHKGENQNATGW